MSGESETAKIVKDLTGMWWPAADAGSLRSAASAWTAMASAIDALTAPANTAAQAVIGGNKSPAIDAFQGFWEKYYKGSSGWLPDSASACRQMAKALTGFADEVDKAVSMLEEEAVVVGATLVAGTALAFFTAGLSEAAAGAATASIIAAADAIGVTVTETVATIAGTALTGVVFGSVESVAVDAAVAQPVRVAFGDGGFSGTELLSAAETGGAAGGITGGLGAGARSLTAAADSAGDASSALTAVSRISAALDTMPGRMATGAGFAAAQDALTNNGSINGLDVLAGAIGGGASRAPTKEDLGTRRDWATRNSLDSTEAVAPKISGDATLPSGDPVYFRPASTAIGYDFNTIHNFDVVKPLPGYHDVVVHGNNEGYFEPGRINTAGQGFSGGDTHPTHIIEAIRNNPNYDGGPIRLLSCHTGTVAAGSTEIPAAQEVANQLGVPVLAPTNKVGTLRYGGPNQIPTISSGGYWRTFLPIAE
jgi:hypothetical protein